MAMRVIGAAAAECLATDVTLPGATGRAAGPALAAAYNGEAMQTLVFESGYPHGRIGGNIQWLLGEYVRRAKSGIVFDSSQGFDLPSGDTVEPDHSFVSNERWALAPAPEVGKFLGVVPDLVVEVLLTSTASKDRGEKKAIYERNGVREYWLVDSRARSVTVFLLEEARFDLGRRFDETEKFTSSVLAGLDVDVTQIFV
jgi:Uma2 family endonuclease